MLAKVCSAALNGIEAFPVEVEVNAGWGETIIVIVGLPDAAVNSDRSKVKPAVVGGSRLRRFMARVDSAESMATASRKRRDQAPDFAASNSLTLCITAKASAT